MNRFFAGLSRNVVRYRWVVILFWIALAVVSSKALPSLSSEVNNDNSQFLSASEPSSRAAALLDPILGNSTTESQLNIVVGRTNRPLDASDNAALQREAAAARKVSRVVSVRELATSPSGKAAQLLVTARINQADISRLTTLANGLRSTFASARAPAGLQLHLAGTIATNVANQKSSNSAGGRTQGLTFILILVLLLVIFRSPLAPILTLLPAAFALIVSMRFIGGLGVHGLKISEITQLLLIVLLLGAGTDYGLFLVFRVREEMSRGRSSHEAVIHALERVGESISASAGTVIFALLSLLFASFGVYHDLGLPLALGVAVMLIAGLTLLPALLAIAGRGLFWPVRPKRGPAREGAWGRIAAQLVRRPAITLALGVVFFGALSFGALAYHSSGFGGALNAPAGSDAAAGNAIVAAQFPRSSVNPANLVFHFTKPVYDDPSVLQRAEKDLAASGTFRQLAGPLDGSGFALSPARYQALHAALGNPAALPARPPAGSKVSPIEYDAFRTTIAYVSPDGRTVQYEATLRAGGQASTSALDATPHVRAVVTRVAHEVGASESGVAGQAAALYDVSSTSNGDLLRIIPIAIAAIAVLLALVLRSLVAPLYLIVSVALSYLAALGLSSLIFIKLAGNAGLTFILPFLMFIFLLALGEDYNILVMTRIREEAHRRPLREAVVYAVGRTGPTVTSAGLVLAGTFGVLVVGAGSGPGSGQIRDIGVGLAIGILMDTFLVRTLLVPSTVALLGRWNWWPSRLTMDQPLEPKEETTAPTLEHVD
ncbi:MAG: hypothetical protein JWM85_714 [Acidimicrobiaceae bacterium]|nr:hypothetical protein [Acidimicrobiaceae bacterium]